MATPRKPPDREEEMAEVFDLLIGIMKSKLKSTAVSPGDLKEIRGFLKDNGVELARMKGNKIDSLANSVTLPFSGSDDYDEDA